MLHVGNMYLHFPLNVAIVHLMFANEKYIRCIWDMDCKYLVMNFGISPTQTNKKLCDLFAMVKWPFKGLSDLHLRNQKIT